MANFKVRKFPPKPFPHMIFMEHMVINGVTHFKVECPHCHRHVVMQYIGAYRNQSCGCMRKALNATKHTTHGLKHTPTYHSWKGLIGRCRNPANVAYSYYGGRGITVCDRWLKFEHFLADMGIAPKGLSIGRIDNDGGYCKENCRWETAKQQANNRRKPARSTHELQNRR